MIKKYTFLAFGLIAFSSINAQTTYNVVIGDAGLDIDTVWCEPGDAVQWSWAGTGTHTSTSTEVPAGASTWDFTLTCPSCLYAITCSEAGTYKYTDLNNTSVLGVIIATLAAGGVGVTDNVIELSLRNNPGTMVSLVYEFANDEDHSFEIYSLSGKLIQNGILGKSGTLELTTGLNVDGTFIVQIKEGNKLIATEKFNYLSK